MATPTRLATAEPPAMLAQRPHVCADRAIRSERSPGVGAAARSQPVAVDLRVLNPTSTGSSTNLEAVQGLARPLRPHSSQRWTAPTHPAPPAAPLLGTSTRLTGFRD